MTNTRDGPVRLRNSGEGVTAALKGLHTLPKELFDLLPVEVVMAYYRGEPCIPMDKDKKPLVKWKQYQGRLPRADELRRWVYGFEDRIALWARVTGHISGVIVLDDDGGGWLEKWGLSPHVETRRGGKHWIGRHPGWNVKTINCVTSRELGEAFPALDIRADGGYSIICGSGYKWLREPDPDPLDLLPRHVRRFFGLDERPKVGVCKAGPAGPLPKGNARIPVSRIVNYAARLATSYGRNNAGFVLARELRDNGYSEAEAEGLGGHYRAQVGHTDTRGKVTPYTDEEWLETVRSAYSQSARSPWRER